MQEIWDRIEAWLRAHVPWHDYAEGFSCIPLPGGAGEDLIWVVEEMLSRAAAMYIRLPEDVRESYLIHNGCQAVFESYDLMRIENIPPRYSVMLGRNEFGKKEFGRDRELIKTVGPMKNHAWDPGWIPLTDVGGPNFMCVDFSPTEGGKVGQLIYVSMAMQSGHVLATGFKAWLATFADELESGLFYWDDSVEMIRRSGRRLFEPPSSWAVVPCIAYSRAAAYRWSSRLASTPVPTENAIWAAEGRDIRYKDAPVQVHN